MCGICGIYGSVNEGLLRRMCSVIRYRGPDDFGFFLDKNIGLGIRRLSVIDIEGGHQPIHNENENVWVVCNGEIYNYQQLRQHLEGSGHRFSTNSDTETIVHLYEELGTSCADRLRGMFAFALWDSDARKLLLARDIAGEKPLYYATTDGKLVFASEIKSILQEDSLERKIDYIALHNYLTFRFVPGNSTLFETIRRLPPGHIMICGNGGHKIIQYWSVRNLTDSYEKRADYLQFFHELLSDAVRTSLVSDVPLGVFVSGGIDSSTILGIMSKFSDEPVRTFSVGFGVGEPVDELHYARRIAEFFEADHHELIVESNDLLKYLPKVIWHLDEPLGDAMISVPIYLMSELAKKYVTVILTGTGADELFGGYVHHKPIYVTDVLCRNRLFSTVILKRLLSRLIKCSPLLLLNSFFEYPFSLGKEGKERIIKYISCLGDSPTNRSKCYLTLVSHFTEEDKKELYSKNLDFYLTEYQLVQQLAKTYFEGTDKTFLEQVLTREFETWLPNSELLRMDKTSMAHSVEARTPYLNRELVEFTLRAPIRWKRNFLTDKFLLRKCLSNFLPPDIVKRKKHPFVVPLDHEYEKNLKDLASNILSEENLAKRDYFKFDYVRRLITHWQRSKLIYSRQLAALITFEIWHRIFIDNPSPSVPSLNLFDLLSEGPI